MTDYDEEQRNEIEALESIYPEELKVITDEPYYSFTIDIKTDVMKDDPDVFMAASLKFTYVPSYPDDPPLIEIESTENLEDDDINDLEAFLNEKVQENLGMAMVFTVVSESSEWLNLRVQHQLQKKKEEEEMRLRKKEEEDLKRFDGTKVTVETFLNWKAKFDKEIAELGKGQNKETAVKKLTGRELFEKDFSLIESDLQFFQEANEEVKVDESLFQELDDLELQEDFDDNDSS